MLGLTGLQVMKLVFCWEIRAKFPDRAMAVFEMGSEQCLPEHFYS